MSTSMLGAPGRYNFGFGGIPTFMRSPYEADVAALQAQWAVIGMPFDEGSSFAPGSRFGPRSIREHSLRFPAAGVCDAATGKAMLSGMVAAGRIVDVGDVDVLITNPERSLQNLSDLVKAVRTRGARSLVIGGDHAITYPVLRAFDEDVHVIHLDAHTDYMQITEDVRHSNGQGFRQLHALPQVSSLTQIGIRGLRNLESDMRDARSNGSRIVLMPELRREGAAGALGHLPDGAKVYVSIDIDAFDMTLVPGCVSAEPDGITYEQMHDLLRVISQRFEVRGFDLVEVNPQLDVATGVTSYLAAYTIIDFLGLIELRERASG